MRMLAGICRPLVVLLLASSAGAQTTPTLAVSSRADKAVLFFGVAGAGAALQPLDTIALDAAPDEMCLAPNGKRLFVSQTRAKSIAIIDLEKKAVTGRLTEATLQAPDGCAVSPDAKKLYSVDSQGDVVFVFSADDARLLKKIPVGKTPRRALFAPDGKRLLVSNSESNTLSVIDPATDTVVKTVRTGTEPRDMAFSPDGALLAVSLIHDDSAGFFDAATLEFKQQAASAWSPQHIEFSPDSRHLYVVGKIGNVVNVMRVAALSRMEGSIALPYGPLGMTNFWGLAMSPDGKYLYVTNLGEGTLLVVDPEAMHVLRGYAAGKTPTAVVYIKPSAGIATMTAASRMERYRTLARSALEAALARDFTAAARASRTLEQEFDAGEVALRQRSPQVWEDIDRAMDEFIMPLMRTGTGTVDAAKLQMAYDSFLAKLKGAG
jgi:YVTN family beta-propeller protein